MVAEDDVLGHCEWGYEPEVLVDHRDPGVDRVPRRVEHDRASGEDDLALVGPVEAGEDVRERRLAGAVLTEQCVHLTRRCVEVDVIVRDDAGEPLGDSP